MQSCVLPAGCRCANGEAWSWNMYLSQHIFPVSWLLLQCFATATAALFLHLTEEPFLVLFVLLHLNSFCSKQTHRRRRRRRLFAIFIVVDVFVSNTFCIRSQTHSTTHTLHMGTALKRAKNRLYTDDEVDINAFVMADERTWRKGSGAGSSTTKCSGRITEMK